jgi:hypothetical protein
MENLLLILATSFVLRLSSSKKIRNYRIGLSGCSTLWFNDHPFERTLTRTGDTMHFNEHAEKGVTYGIICIGLDTPYRTDESTTMLVSYLESLREPFGISHFTGITRTRDWNNPHSHTFSDYWQDADGCDWKVKGYTNGTHLAVLYVKNISDADANRQDAFLDGFYFSPVALPVQ